MMEKKSRKTEILLTRILQKQSSILWKDDLYRHKDKPNGSLRRRSALYNGYHIKYYYVSPHNYNWEQAQTAANAEIESKYDLIKKNHIEYKKKVGTNYFSVQDEFARLSGIKLQIPYKDIGRKFIVCKVDSAIIDGLLTKATKAISIELLTHKIKEMYGKE